MYTSRSLLLSIIDEATFADTMQAAHNSSLNEAHRAINVVILDSRNQDLLALLEQVLLDRANVLNVADVLVKLWVYSHVLGADGEALPVLILVLDVKYEWDARWVLRHHFFQKTHRKMHTLNNERLIAFVETVNNFGQLLCNQGRLLLVSFQSDPVLACILAILLRDHVASLVS